MVHKPKHKVHSFRGLLGDGEEDEINLERQNVNLAYRITKFQVMGPDNNTNFEQVLKIYNISTTASTTIDFSDPTLLGAAVIGGDDSRSILTQPVIIFDNVLFSRNIFVTNKGHDNTASVNYYLELEEVPVTASTLMQIKLGTARRLGGSSMGN